MLPFALDMSPFESSQLWQTGCFSQQRGGIHPLLEISCPSCPDCRCAEHSGLAQVSINIGPEPVCPYGYYDFASYDCAPYGYYGPEWFSGGVFIGAGPWFHGPHTSTARLIIASIRIAAMLAHFRNAEPSPSTTSTEMKCATDAATLWAKAIARSGVKLFDAAPHRLGGLSPRWLCC